MAYYIDQSGKIEDTARPTVIAFSDSVSSGSLILPGNDKRFIQRYYRNLGKPRLYVLHTFSVLIVRLISLYRLHKAGIVIDREYTGHEALTISYISFLLKQRLPTDRLDVRFGHVGKTTKAHKLANQCLYYKKAEYKLATTDILSYLNRLLTLQGYKKRPGTS